MVCLQMYGFLQIYATIWLKICLFWLAFKNYLCIFAMW